MATPVELDGGLERDHGCHVVPGLGRSVLHRGVGSAAALLRSTNTSCEEAERERPPREPAHLLHRCVVVGDVGLVVLLVVKPHDLGVHYWLQGRVVVRQVRQLGSGEGAGAELGCEEPRCVQEGKEE